MATTTATTNTTGTTGPLGTNGTEKHDRRGFRNSTGTTGTDHTRVGHRAIGPRFSFGSWLKLHALDILTMAAMGAAALGIHFAGPAPTRTFAIFNTDGSIADYTIAYPLRSNRMPLWAAVLISFLVPLLFFTLFQFRRRSVDDWLTTTLGLLRSLITAALFQVFIKWLIGGLRPHFLAICQPQLSSGDSLNGMGFQNIIFDRSICTGDPDDIDEAMESMPSGHATAAWAGLFFLALYFNAQLKVIAAHNPAYWKMIMFFAPLLGAFLISATLVVDRHHHWYDLVVGGLIGISTALIAYRQTFAAIWDYRFNHVLLPRATSFFHRKPYLPFPNRGPYYNYQPGFEFTSRDLPVSREGGWDFGGGEASNGAPNDATALSVGLGGAAMSAATGAGKGYGQGYGTGSVTDPRSSHEPMIGHNAPATAGHHGPAVGQGVV